VGGWFVFGSVGNVCSNFFYESTYVHRVAANKRNSAPDLLHFASMDFEQFAFLRQA